MAIKVNNAGKAHARSLIKEGKVDRGKEWSFSPEDGNKILGDNNWGEYKKWFLGIDDSQNEETKAHYKFPFGKNGKVYRAGVIAAKRRAAQYGHSDIESAADDLLKEIDKEKAKAFIKMQANEKIELLLYGDIGWDIIAKEVIDQIKEANPEELVLRINSRGGDYFEGLSLYNFLKQLSIPKTVYIDGLAASAASLVACAGKVLMPANAYLVIHNPRSGLLGGESKDMSHKAEILTRLENSTAEVYKEKTGLSLDRIHEMMDAETWLGSSEAKELGFCDEIIPAKSDRVILNLVGYHNVPPEYYEYCKRSEKMGEKKKLVLSLAEILGVKDIEEKGINVDEAYDKICAILRVKEGVEKGKEKEGKSSIIDPELTSDPKVLAAIKKYEEKLKENEEKIRQYEARTMALETVNFVNEIKGRVGDELARTLGEIRTAIPKEAMDRLIEKIEGMREMINELGKPKGSKEKGSFAPMSSEEIDKQVREGMKKVQEELGCSASEAAIEFAKRNPSLVAQWK